MGTQGHLASKQKNQDVNPELSSFSNEKEFRVSKVEARMNDCPIYFTLVHKKMNYPVSAY